MEGEFWMPYMDFIKTFTHLEVVHLDSETSRDEPSMADKKRWSMRFYSGAWQRGVTAGGCRNNSGDNNIAHFSDAFHYLNYLKNNFWFKLTLKFLKCTVTSRCKSVSP